MKQNILNILRPLSIIPSIIYPKTEKFNQNFIKLNIQNVHEYVKKRQQEFEIFKKLISN